MSLLSPTTFSNSSVRLCGHRQALVRIRNCVGRSTKTSNCYGYPHQGTLLIGCRIADLVSTIFIEKFRIYHGKTNKDSAVDSNDSTPQPPQKNTSMASTGSTSMTESSPPQEPEKVSKKPTIVPGVSNEQRNSSVSWKTQDSYGVSPLHQESGRQTAARTSEVVADDTSSW
jgi:hypothetical protein